MNCSHFGTNLRGENTLPGPGGNGYRWISGLDWLEVFTKCRQKEILLGALSAMAIFG